MAKKSKTEPEDTESKPKPAAKSHSRSLISQIFSKGKKNEKSEKKKSDSANDEDEESTESMDQDDGSGSTKLDQISTASSQADSGISEGEESGPAKAPNGSAYPQSGLAKTTNASAYPVSGSANPPSGSANQQLGSSASNKASAFSKQNGSAFRSITSGGSAASQVPGSSSVRTGNSDSAVIREESGSGGGLKKPRSGPRSGNPLNEQDELDNEINELMPESDFPRSNSPVLPARNPDFQLDEEGRMVEVVPCTICGRKFAVDRIQTHANICSQTRERKPYDVAMMRVAGTEAEELVKAGKLILEPAKPIPKKSVLHQQIPTLGGLGLGNTEPLPPIVSKDKKGTTAAPTSPTKRDNSKATSYQIVFDQNDDLKTRKTSKFSGFPANLPNSKLPKQKIDNRFLSADAAKRSGNNASYLGTDYMVDSDEDDNDYLAASMASQKSVCSDAFDFLFDSQNLNPDTIQEKLKRQDSTWSAAGNFNKKKEGKSSVCAIS